MLPIHRGLAVATLLAFAGLAGCETHPEPTNAPAPVTTGEKIKEKAGEIKEKAAELTNKAAAATAKGAEKVGTAIENGAIKLENAVKKAEGK